MQVFRKRFQGRFYINKNMKTRILPYLALALLLGCSPTRHKHAGSESNAATATAVAVRDTTPKVTGIGGIFFVSDDPKAAREWYGKNLGLSTNQYGATFETHSPWFAAAGQRITRSGEVFSRHAR